MGGQINRTTAKKAMVTSLLLQSKGLTWLKKECGIHIVLNENLKKRGKCANKCAKNLWRKCAILLPDDFDARQRPGGPVD
jgi:hypothetical protein